MLLGNYMRALEICEGSVRNCINHEGSVRIEYHLHMMLASCDGAVREALRWTYEIELTVNLLLGNLPGLLGKC